MTHDEKEVLVLLHDMLQRVTRLESRMVQLMLYMNCDPAKRYELEKEE